MIKMRTFLTVAIVLFCSLSSFIDFSYAQPMGLLTGFELEKKLNEWTSVTFLEEDETFADLCQQISSSQSISIVLDRRMDPGRQVTLPLPISGSLSEVLQRVASDQQAVVDRLGDAFVIVPEYRTQILRTLAAMHEQNLKEFVRKAPSQERSQWLTRLLRRSEYSWRRLSEPRQLIESLAEEAEFAINNPDDIPHDLWRAHRVPATNPIELISLFLFQYDLSYQWEEDGSMTIIPLPNQISVTKKYRLPSAQIKTVEERFQNDFPAATFTARGSGNIEISGSAELHDAIQAWQSGKSEKESMGKVAWKDKRYTLKVERKSLSVVLAYLKEAGLPVVYDLEAMKARGVEVDRLVTFETTQADAQELFEKICGPFRLPFRITNEAILVDPQD